MSPLCNILIIWVEQSGRVKGWGFHVGFQIEERGQNILLLKTISEWVMVVLEAPQNPPNLPLIFLGFFKLSPSFCIIKLVVWF